MRRIFGFFAALCLLSGLGMAQADSLTANTDTFQVAAPAHSDFSGALFAKATKKHSVSDASDSASSVSGSIDKNFWVKAYGGFDDALQGDYVNGMKALTTYATSSGFTASTKGDGTGFAAGGEFGFQFDPEDALSIGCENIWGSTLSSSGTQGSNSYNETVTPSTLDLTLNYYRTLVNSNGAKTDVFIGGGLYFGSSNLSFATGGTNIFSGDFTGSTLGGVLGIDEDITLSDTFSFQVSAKGRLASIGKESSSSVTGALPSGTYDMTMTTDIGSASPILFINPETTPMDANTRLAVTDESGFQGDVEIVAHF